MEEKFEIRELIVKHTRFLLVIVIAACVLFAGIAMASETTDGRGYYSSGVEANPLFEEAGEERALTALSPDVEYSESIDYRDTEEAMAEDLRAGMVGRENVILVGFRTDAEREDWLAWAKSVFAMAVAHTGEPKEGDTLTWHWRDRSIDISVDGIGGFIYVTVSYTINYYTTAEMEAEFDRAVEALLAELDLWESDAYGKILGIYKYICDHVSYDRANVSDTNYTLKYTPYAALFHRKAVCQGIALLYYRLALELDLDVRIIFGTGRNVNHTWLIVRLGESYFYLDPTWDLGKGSYGYFLKGEKNFSDHKRTDNPLCGLYYTAPSFYGAYPVSGKNFVLTDLPEEGVGGSFGDGGVWHLGMDGRLVIAGAEEIPDFRDSDAPWAAAGSFVREIVIDKSVRQIGAYSFCECTNVGTVVLYDSSVEVGENAFSELTEVVDAEKRVLSTEADGVLAESADGTRYLVLETIPADLIALGERFELAGTDRIQVVSSDGSERLTGLDGVTVGVRVQLLDKNGGVADEVTVALWGDFDLNGVVDDADAVFLLWSFLKPQAYASVPRYDLNGDGIVNASDAAFAGE